MATNDSLPALDDLGPFVFGGSIIGWTVPRETVGALMEAFLDAGGKAIDTADNYTDWVAGGAAGRSEALLGEWLAQSGRRKDVLIASKVGRASGYDNPRRDTILRAIEGSLKRLKTDYLDTYYIHRDDPNTSLLETLQTLDGLVQQGVVRSLGYCWIEPKRLAEAQRLIRDRGFTPISFFQHEYNIVDHERFETLYPELSVDPNVNVLGFHGLKSGFLSGKYVDPQIRTDHTAKIEALLDDARTPRLQYALNDIARKYGVAPAAVALAWFQTRPIRVVPLVSARDETQLRELFQAQDVELSVDDIRRLQWRENLAA
ncbi:aldo/keto reductase [Microvirga zambiensis]|uniref:aldo/keto reductase n=1 Tax=Microvirga zambiensis TaxID=1402137 RepID=UPI00191E8665|nr:aldo/keto reductase [Microvirga zambiensis]